VLPALEGDGLHQVQVAAVPGLAPAAPEFEVVPDGQALHELAAEETHLVLLVLADLLEEERLDLAHEAHLRGPLELFLQLVEVEKVRNLAILEQREGVEAVTLLLAEVLLHEAVGHRQAAHAIHVCLQAFDDVLDIEVDVRKLLDL